MGVPAEYLAQQLVESGQVPAAVQEVRRGKAAAIIAERVAVTDADGTAIDVKAQIQALIAAQQADLEAGGFDEEAAIQAAGFEAEQDDDEDDDEE
jgi:trigger factor